MPPIVLPPGVEAQATSEGRRVFADRIAVRERGEIVEIVFYKARGKAMRRVLSVAMPRRGPVH